MNTKVFYIFLLILLTLLLDHCTEGRKLGQVSSSSVLPSSEVPSEVSTSTPTPTENFVSFVKDDSGQEITEQQLQVNNENEENSSKNSFKQIKEHTDLVARNDFDIYKINEKHNRTTFAEVGDNNNVNRNNRKQNETENTSESVTEKGTDKVTEKITESVSELQLKNNVTAKSNLKEKCTNALKEVNDLLLKNDENVDISTNGKKREALTHIKNKLKIFLEQIQSNNTNSSYVEQQINEATNEISKYSETSKTTPENLTDPSISTNEKENDDYVSMLTKADNIEKAINGEVLNMEAIITETQNILNASVIVKQKWEQKITDSSEASMEINLLDKIQQIKSKTQENKNTKSIILSKTKSVEEISGLIKTSCYATKGSHDYKNIHRNSSCLNVKPLVTKLEHIHEQIHTYGQQMLITLNNMKTLMNDVTDIDRQLDAYISQNQANKKQYKRDLFNAAEMLKDLKAERFEAIENIQNAQMNVMNSYEFFHLITGIFENTEIDAEKKKIDDEISQILVLDLSNYETNAQHILDLITNIEETLKHKVKNTTLQKLLQKVEETEKSYQTDKLATDAIIEQLKKLQTKINTFKDNYLEKLHNVWSKNIAQMIQDCTTTKDLITMKKESFQLKTQTITEIKRNIETLITKYSSSDPSTTTSNDLEKELYNEANETQIHTQLYFAEMSGAIEQCKNIADNLQSKSDYLTFLITKIKNDDSINAYINAFKTLINEITDANISEYVKTEKENINALKAQQYIQEWEQINRKIKVLKTLTIINNVQQNMTTYLKDTSDEIQNYQQDLKRLEQMKTQLKQIAQYTQNIQDTADKHFSINAEKIESSKNDIESHLLSMQKVVDELTEMIQECKNFKNKYPQDVTDAVTKQFWNDSQEKLKKADGLTYLYESTKITSDRLKNSISALDNSYLIHYQIRYQKKLSDSLMTLKESTEADIRLIEQIENNPLKNDYETLATDLINKNNFTTCVNEVNATYSNLIKEKNLRYEYIKALDEYIEQLKQIVLKKSTQINLNELERNFADLEKQSNSLLKTINEKKTPLRNLHETFFVNIIECEKIVSNDFINRANVYAKNRAKASVSLIENFVYYIHKIITTKIQVTLFSPQDDFDYSSIQKKTKEKMTNMNKNIKNINNLFSAMETKSKTKGKVNSESLALALQGIRKQMEQNISQVILNYANLNTYKNQIINMHNQLNNDNLYTALRLTKTFERIHYHINLLQQNLAKSNSAEQTAKQLHNEMMKERPNEQQKEEVINTQKAALKNNADLINKQLVTAYETYKQGKITYNDIVTNCRFLNRSYQRIVAMLNSYRYSKVNKSKTLEQPSQYIKDCKDYINSTKNDLMQIEQNFTTVKRYYTEIIQAESEFSKILYKSRIRNKADAARKIFQQISNDEKEFKAISSHFDTIDEFIEDTTNIINGINTEVLLDTHKRTQFYTKFQASIEHFQNIKEYKNHMIKQINSIITTANEEVKKIEKIEKQVIASTFTTKDIESMEQTIDMENRILKRMQRLLSLSITYKKYRMQTLTKIQAETISLENYRNLYTSSIIRNLMTEARSKTADIKSLMSNIKSIINELNVFQKQNMLPISDEEIHELQEFLAEADNIVHRSVALEEDIKYILENFESKKNYSEIKEEIQKALQKYSELIHITQENQNSLKAQEFVNNFYKKQFEKINGSIREIKTAADIIKSEIDKNYKTAATNFQIVSNTKVMKEADQALYSAVNIKRQIVEKSSKYEKKITEAKKVLNILQLIITEMKPSDSSTEIQLFNDAQKIVQDMNEHKQSIDEINTQMEQIYHREKENIQKTKKKQEALKIYKRIQNVKKEIEDVTNLLRLHYNQTKNTNIQNSTETEPLLKDKILNALINVINNNKKGVEDLYRNIEDLQTDFLKTSTHVDKLKTELDKEKTSISIQEIQNIKNDMIKDRQKIEDIYERTLDLGIQLRNLVDTIKKNQKQYVQTVAAHMNTIAGTFVDEVSAVSTQIEILKSQIEEQYEDMIDAEKQFSENIDTSNKTIQHAARMKEKIKEIEGKLNKYYDNINTSLKLIKTTDDETQLLSELKKLENINKQINHLKMEAEEPLSSMAIDAMQETQICIQNRINIIERNVDTATTDYNTIKKFTEEIEQGNNNISNIIKEIEAVKVGNEEEYFNTIKAKINEVQKLEQMINTQKDINSYNENKTIFLNNCHVYKELIKGINENEKKLTYIKKSKLQKQENNRLSHLFEQNESTFSENIKLFEKNCEKLQNIYSDFDILIQKKEQLVNKSKELIVFFHDLYMKAEKQYNARLKANEIKQHLQKIIENTKQYGESITTEIKNTLSKNSDNTDENKETIKNEIPTFDINTEQNEEPLNSSSLNSSSSNSSSLNNSQLNNSQSNNSQLKNSQLKNSQLNSSSTPISKEYVENIKNDKEKLTKMINQVNNLINKSKTEDWSIDDTFKHMSKNDNESAYKEAEKNVNEARNIINELKETEKHIQDLINEVDIEETKEHTQEDIIEQTQEEIEEKEQNKQNERKGTSSNTIYNLASGITIGLLVCGFVTLLSLKKYKKNEYEDLSDIFETLSYVDTSFFKINEGEHIEPDDVLNLYKYGDNLDSSIETKEPTDTTPLKS